LYSDDDGESLFEPLHYVTSYDGATARNAADDGKTSSRILIVLLKCCDQLQFNLKIALGDA